MGEYGKFELEGTLLQLLWLGGGKSSLWRAREERAARRETGFQVVGNPEK